MFGIIPFHFFLCDHVEQTSVCNVTLVVFSKKKFVRYTLLFNILSSPYEKGDDSVCMLNDSKILTIETSCAVQQGW